jgi:hypothetical protein
MSRAACERGFDTLLVATTRLLSVVALLFNPVRISRQL